MKKQTWQKHHKWLGLLFCFFLLMFCFSGVILNHREAVSSVDISRAYLPSHFQYQKWNNGLLKGSLRLSSDSSKVYLYGNAGVIQTDVFGKNFQLCNDGFPMGVDHRNIQAMVELPGGELYALGQFALYKQVDNRWIELFKTPKERFVDLIQFDTEHLAVLSRSYIYQLNLENDEVEVVALLAPKGYKEEVTLFRTIWLIHSGELFGLAGKIVVDLVAVVLIVLSLTGLLYWLLPKRIRRLKKRGSETGKSVKLLKGSLSWHDKIGRYTIVITLFVTFTGWCLRPPLLIPLALTKVAPLPGTILKSDNPWNDKLRSINFDKEAQEWLISTSDGFFTLKDLKSTPVKVEHIPPVSVMGITVFSQKEDGEWIIGSFSGLYLWNRVSGNIVDYFTGEQADNISAAPFGKRAISGYTSDINNEPVFVEFDSGTDVLGMPSEFRKLPMSLWNVSLEIHTGRIYTFLGDGTLVYITFAGLLVLWILISGYVLRKRKRNT